MLTRTSLLATILLGSIMYSNNLLADDCMHPGPSGLVPGPCIPPSGSPSFFHLPLGTLSAGQDLDITYIERIPRYPSYCRHFNVPCEPAAPTGGCLGLVVDAEHPDGKRWPDSGETVQYRAHIINKGGQNSSGFSFQWFENGLPVSTAEGGSGTRPGLPPGVEQLVLLYRTWSGVPGTIALSITPTDPDLFVSNNSLSIDTHGLALKVYVADSTYAAFNQYQGAYSETFSFEDFLQKNIGKMNELFSQAIYEASPMGILDRVRLDSIQIYTPPVSHPEINNSDPLLHCVDGTWQYNENTNPLIADEMPHWNLIHELGHYIMGLIDLYNMKLPGGVCIAGSNDGQPCLRESDCPGGTCSRVNNGVQLDPLVLIDPSGCAGPPPHSHPPLCADVFEEPEGIMNGGSIFPYSDEPHIWSKHDVLAANSEYGQRRYPFYRAIDLYFGATSWDTPETNYLRVLKDDGTPIPGATIAMYQKSNSLDIDNTPEITGTTDQRGIMLLPNRSAGTPISTATGHMLRDNPFGEIHRFGYNSTFLVRAEKAGGTWYRWLTVHDLNVAYWMGNSDIAVLPVGPCSEGGDADNDNVPGACDNCWNYNPAQRDRDHDGLGDACDACPDETNRTCLKVWSDAWVDEMMETSNYGSQPQLVIGTISTAAKGGTAPMRRRALLRVNLSNIAASASVSNVRLHLYKINNATGNAVLYRSTEGFNETEVTWSSRPNSSSTPTPMVLALPPVSGWATFDVTAIAADCINNRQGDCSWQLWWGNEVDNVTSGDVLFGSAESGQNAAFVEVEFALP